jgi:CDP-diacylglycerol---glycerol-3-phosphate 3-phosphatidyltransferase
MRGRRPLVVLALSLSRPVLAAGFAGLAALDTHLASRMALLLLALLIEATDLADGRLARRWSIASISGGLVDSGCDCLARTTEFLTLCALGSFPYMAMVPIVARDGIVWAGRVLLGQRSRDALRTRQSGKLKGVCHGSAIIAATSIYLFRPGYGDVIADLVGGVAAFASLASAIDYLRSFGQVARGFRRPQSAA